MGQLTRSYDWSQTAIGPPDQWPFSLRANVGQLLHSSFPMLLFWGRDTMITFYNDAFLPSLGTNGKHPSLGKHAREMWSDVWDYIGPMMDSVMTTGESVYFENYRMPFSRNGRVEESYWTFCYGPAYGDDGRINGVLITCSETTAKVISTQLLLEGNAQLEFAIEAAEMGTFDLNPVTGKFTANKRLKEWFGLREEDEVLLSHALQSIDEQDRERVTTAISRSMEYDSGGSYAETYTIVHPVTGDRKIVRAKGRAQFNDAKQATRLTGTLQDITEPVQASLKLQKSEARLELLSNTVPAMIFYLDDEQRYTTYNETFMQWFGVDKKGALGKTVREFLGEAAYAKVEPHLTIAYGGEQEKFEMMSPSRIYGPRWLSIVYTPHIEDGKVLGLIVHATDITQSKTIELALRDSEERFRSLILEAPFPTSVYVGRELRVDIANEPMIRLWGKTRAVIGKPLADAVPELEGQPFLQILDGMFSSGKSYIATGAPANLEVDGKISTYYFNFIYKPLFDDNGQVYAIINMAIDVTAEVLATQQIEEVVAQRTHELAEANRLLQVTNSELEQFAYVASHDLQEPLRKVMIFTGYLQDHLGEQDVRTRLLLSKIDNSTSRMVQLIKDVLNYSRLSIKSDEYEAIDLTRLLSQIVDDFEVLIEEKNADILCGELPVIKGNPLQMRQLFTNLLSNALKFNRVEDTPVVIIGATKLNEAEKKEHAELLEDKDYCVISVEDNGIGLSEEYADKIFGIFQRLHTKSEYAGTGIGLALCKKIVQNHGGKIWVRAELGKGSVFNVILPVK